MRKLKLIWDFKGPDGLKTAQHHLIHLEEYAVAQQLNCLGKGVEKISDHHHVCYLAVNEEDMPIVRDQLKPHRGQLWTD